jgi:hypothetical protein
MQAAERRGRALSGERGTAAAERCRPHCDVSDPKPGPETQPFVEGVHAGVRPPALQQHVVAVARPCVFQCGQYHGLAVTSASQLGVSDNILQEPVTLSAAKQIRCNDKHAGGSDAIAIIGYKYADTGVRQSFLPDALGALWRLRNRTHLRRIEKREEGRQIHSTGEASDWHYW